MPLSVIIPSKSGLNLYDGTTQSASNCKDNCKDNSYLTAQINSESLLGILFF